MSQTLMQLAYDRLRDKVSSGELKPGDRLVNRTLGEEIGVSTVTVREAIHRLASDGIVEHVPNAGAYIRKLSSKEMVELFSFRAWLDLYTVREASRKIEEHELAMLRKNCADAKGMILQLRNEPDRILQGDAMQRWLELDQRFHKTLVNAAHNSWLTKAIDDLNLLSLVMRSKAPSCSFRDASWTYRQHCEIVASLAKRNEDRACDWMKVHGEQALTTLLDTLGNEEFP